MVQQALSAQIRQLEEELETTLFVRTTRKVELTEAGRILLEEAPVALQQLDSLLQSIRRRAAASGSLTLGLLATSFLDFTPKLLRAFAAERPNVNISIRNVAFSDPTGGVKDGLCDAALVWEPFTLGDLACEALFSEPRVAVLASDHPLARLESIPAALLAQEPFVWVEQLDPVARDYWTLADQRGGKPPNVGARITGFEDLFAVVRAGQAVASSPVSIAGALPWNDLTTRPIEGLKPAVVSICWRPSDQNLFVDALVACARRLAADLFVTPVARVSS